MEKLVSCWSDGKKLPENYIFPPGQRPGEHVIPTSKSIPVIDLGKAEGNDHEIIVQQILEAAQEFGFFQVINHGVPRKLMDDVRGVFKEFFELPVDEKLKFFSLNMDEKCALYTSNVEYAREKIHLWKDSLRICCTPLKECMEYWPQKPPAIRYDVRGVFKEFFELPVDEKLKFFSLNMDDKCALYTSNVEYAREKIHLWKDSLRICCTPLKECMEYWPQKPLAIREIVAEYVVEVTNLGSRILELVSQGLGLQSGYFENGLSQHPLLLINHYPPCPDPSLTLGAAKHCDPNLINILLQDDIPGLQVLKDGEWIGVEPIPDAFVINMGHGMQIVSNGKLRSVEHRVVTNVYSSRTTAAFFISPSEKCDIKPAEALITAERPPIYKTVRFQDVFENFKEAYRGKIDHGLDNFLIKA